MGLFSKKEIPSKIVVRYEGKETDLIWSREILDCNCDCEVVTDAFHKVVYLKNGHIMEDMSADRFTLNTYEKKAKNQEVFDIKLFYVNVNNEYKIKWGTRQQARVIDGFFQVPVSIGASGAFKLKVVNAHKFVAKLCSVRNDLDTQFVDSYFSEELTMYVMQVITREIMSGRTNSYSLWQNAADVAHNMQDELTNVFEDYGVTVTGFSISGIMLSQDDIRQFEEILRKKRLLEMKDSSFREEAEQMKADKQSAMDAIVKLAEIDAKKPTPNVTINNNGASNTMSFCPYCGTKVGDGAFCPGCGKRLK